MRRICALIVVAASAISYGCVSPLAMSIASPERIATLTDGQVCDGYRQTNRPEFFSEITRRSHVATPSELEEIRAHHVFIGMQEAPARCAWGTHYFANSAHRESGVVTIWHYYETGSNVYISDGKVIGFDN